MSRRFLDLPDWLVLALVCVQPLFLVAAIAVGAWEAVCGLPSPARERPR